VAETYWPFDSGAGSASGEDRWYQMAPLWALDGVATSGGLLVTTISGRNLQVATGSAWVHGAYYINDAAKTLAVAANSSGNPRIDRIVLRRDLTANTVTAAVLQGTAAASPAAPALTQSTTGIWEVPIAQYRAESGFVNTDSTKLTDNRLLSGADQLWKQSVMQFASSADRTGKVTPAEGMLSWQQDTNNLDIYTGSAWELLRPVPVPVLRVRAVDATTQTIGTAFTDVQLGEEVEDTVNGWPGLTTSTTYTVQRAGVYSACCGVSYSSNAAGWRILGINVNGTLVPGRASMPPVSGDRTDHTLAKVLRLAASDTVKIQAASPGGALNSGNNTSSRSFLELCWIGP
jgi:hypothetical protein